MRLTNWLHERLDDRAAIPIKAGVTLVIGLLIIGLLASVFLPEVINSSVRADTGANTTWPPADWGTIETTLWELLPMAYVLGVFLFVIALAVDQF